MKNPNLDLSKFSDVAWSRQRNQLPQVRMALNFKCHKACFYCRPSGESVPLSSMEISGRATMREMTTDEIVAIAAALARSGITDIKLTGGDPVLRNDIVEIVHRLKKLDGLRRLELITRHHRVGELLKLLKEGGLDLLNFSLDSLDETTWTGITRVNGHKKLLSAIREAAKTGIPLKLNTVVLKGVNDHEIPQLINFAAEMGAELKLLDLIGDIGSFPGFKDGFLDSYYFDLVPVAEALAKEAKSVEVITQPGGLGHPMPRFVMPNGAVVTVKSAKLGAYYGSICSGCPFFPCWDALMALRITPNGLMQFCLLRGDHLVDLLGAIRREGVEEVDQIIRQALEVYRKAAPLTGDEILKIRSLSDREFTTSETHSLRL